MSKDYYNNIKIYKRVLSDLLKNYKKVFLISILSMITVSITGPIFASLTKPLINNGFVEKNLYIMMVIPLEIIILFLIRGIASFINNYTTTYLSGHLVQTLREKMFDKILKLPLNYYHNNPSGIVISKVLNDANLITEAGFNVISVFLLDGITVLGLIILLIYTDWKLTLITFIALPMVAICLKIISVRLKKLSKDNQMYTGKMTQVLNESIDGIREIKIYNNNNSKEKERFNNIAKTIRINLVKQSISSSISTSTTQFMVALALSAIIYFASLRASNNNFTSGDFVSFLTAMLMMFDPIKRLTRIMQSLQRGVAAAESVFNFLDEPEELDKGQIKIDEFNNYINFKNVSFTYPNSNNYILKDINLKIKKGSMLAIVGASGSGKTTLVNLIPRFYNIKLGNIYFDNIDINNINLQSLRNTISLVSQDIFLFNDTITKNISYGAKYMPTDEELIYALKISNSWEFVKDFPDKINTIIGENGAKLSGGQKQRLAIARAILKNSDILILDEATSALDFKSEALVQNALDKISTNKTIIIIAHRLSTIQKSNKIIVLFNGKIVETGTHESLINLKKYYYNLYNTNINTNYNR